MRAALLAATTSAVLLAPVPVGATGASAAPTVRCPRVPAPAASRPPRPSPPPAVPAQRVVGGAALDTAGLVVPAGAAAPPRVTATSWLVADLDSGQVLGGCGPHEYGTPASVQKLLLAATMLPKLDPKQVVTVTDADMNIEPGSSAVGLVAGGRYTDRDHLAGVAAQLRQRGRQRAGPTRQRDGQRRRRPRHERARHTSSARSRRTRSPRPGWTAGGSSPARTTWR